MSAAYDLEYLRAGLAALEKYLLSNDVYWPIGANAPPGSTPFPQLTLSALLLARARAGARALTPDQRSDLESLSERLEDIRQRWRVAWEQKATREFHARLNLWRDFLEEYRENRENNADRYAYEVQRRVMLELLQPDAANVPDSELEMLSGLDKLLKAVFVQGEFIWEAELKPGFPPQPYWYLYGHLIK